MAFKKNEDFKFNIECVLGTLKESDKHDWIKSVIRVQWGDNPTSLDIRSINPKDNRVGKGISLTNEEADRLVDILLENDYGSLAELENAIKRKRDIFSVTKSVDLMEPDNDEDDYYVINV